MDFSYHRPDDLPTAAALAGAGGRILAGGQSLMPLLRRGAVRTAHLVDINGLPDLDAVRVTGEGIEIGALARLERLRTDPLIAAEAPLLARALDWVANPAVRERGTLVGNLVHNAPGAEAAAVAALAGAHFTCWSPEGARIVPLGGAGLTDLVISVTLRRAPSGTRAGFHEAQRRFGHVCVVGCGVEVRPDGSVEAAFAGLTEAPLVAPALGRALAGGARDDRRLAAAIGEDLGSRPVRADLHADAAYRREVAPVVARRALAAALREAAA